MQRQDQVIYKIANTREEGDSLLPFLEHIEKELSKISLHLDRLILNTLDTDKKYPH